MAFTVYPVGADSGFSEESAISSELDRLMQSLGGRMNDHIVDPFSGGDFSLTTSGSSYDVDVAAGDAFVGGHYVESGSTVTVTVDGSATNELFLVVDNAETDNATITYTSDGSTPSGLYVVKTHEVSTDGSGVTGTTDFRPYIAFPGDQTNTAVDATKDGEATGIDVSTTGTVTTSVTFSQPYRNTAPNVQATVSDLSDNTTEFGHVSAQNVTVSGFDIVVNVTATGGTADVAWTARGT